MANPFSKGWKYLQASLDQSIDENADPQIQIRQAVEGAKKQHQQISQQAAAVIGNKNQLEMKLNRLIEEQQKLADKTRQALTLADQANAQGDAIKSQEFSSTAEIYATQLVSVETQLEETKTLHAQATQNAEQAKRQVQQSEARLKQQLAEADQLLNQARQAKMQESATKAMDTMNQLKPDDSVPTLDHVRAKIESRYATAMGAQELLENSVGDRLAEIEAASNDMKASAKLAEIRAQMHGGDSATGGQLTAGSDSTSPQLPAGTGMNTGVGTNTGVDAGTTPQSGFGAGSTGGTGSAGVGGTGAFPASGGPAAGGPVAGTPMSGTQNLCSKRWVQTKTLLNPQALLEQPASPTPSTLTTPMWWKTPPTSQPVPSQKPPQIPGAPAAPETAILLVTASNSPGHNTKSSKATGIASEKHPNFRWFPLGVAHLPQAPQACG